MLQIVYMPEGERNIDKFVSVSKYDELMEIISYNTVGLLSIPVNEDSYDIIDAIISDKLKVKKIHLQQSGDLVKRLKLFFYIAQRYSEEDIKKDVILKHEFLDSILK